MCETDHLKNVLDCCNGAIVQWLLSLVHTIGSPFLSPFWSAKLFQYGFCLDTIKMFVLLVLLSSIAYTQALLLRVAVCWCSIG